MAKKELLEKIADAIENHDEAMTQQAARQARRATIARLAQVLEESEYLFGGKKYVNAEELCDVLEAAGNLVIPDFRITVSWSSGFEL